MRHTLCRLRLLLSAAALSFSFCSTAFAAPVHVEVTFVVVDDLAPRPVPFTDFSLTDSTGHATTFRTDASGKLEADLEPGSYTISTVRPVAFKDKDLTWNKVITVSVDGPHTWSLTDGDATVTEKAAEAPRARRVSDEALVYEKARRSAVAIEVDSGSGSGFLVDSGGLILTNQHVVNGTHFIAVKLSDGRRAAATLISQDAEADVAVIRINPALITGLTPLVLAKPVDGTVAVVGERVLAIGSPLHQRDVLTTGVISKVEKDVLISDVNVNHGNSGGPLLNLAGEVIGITTFGDFSEQGGPGISGVVSIEKARPVLEEARKIIVGSVLPPAELLPTVSDVPIPLETLNLAASEKLEPIPTDAPKNFQAFVLTPFIMASEQAAADREMLDQRNKRAKHRSSQGDTTQERLEPRRFWERYAVGDIEGGSAVVAIVMMPQIKETKGSVFGGALSTVLLGTRVSRAQYRYRDDFYDMELYRGDKLVQPVRCIRIPTSVYYDGTWATAKDTAMGGVYMYDPRDFVPGEKMTLRVRRESDLSRPAIVNLNNKAQQIIWDDFSTWRTALAQSTVSK